jgi:hypothetical protein
MYLICLHCVLTELIDNFEPLQVYINKAYLQSTPLTMALNVFALTPVSDVNVTHIWLDDEVMVGGSELPQMRSINSDTGPGPSWTCK